MLLYSRLLKRHGHQGWWPAESAFEMFVGAILTQQTQWRNVETAISNMKRAGLMSPEAVSGARITALEKAIRPAGYYRQKSVRVKDITSRIIQEFGSFDNILILGREELRSKLLSYNGIGNETADSIVLYAAGKPEFVIDTYTRRILGRVTRIEIQDYAGLQDYITSRIAEDVDLYKDFHAQFVELAKRNCRMAPLCDGCPLSDMCAHARSAKGK